MLAHGGPDWDLTDGGGGIIEDNEIAALWFHYYNPSTNEETDIYPTDTIVIANSCYGYWYPFESPPTPFMARAFVNYGAAAFVGATFMIPAEVIDLPMRWFWGNLTEDNTDVLDATIAICEGVNNPPYDWNVGDDWKILGDNSTTLP